MPIAFRRARLSRLLPAKANTVKSRFSDLLRPELNHGAPTAPAEGLILMNVGYEGLVWQVDEYSRARATALSAMVQERMAGGECGKDDAEGDGEVAAERSGMRRAIYANRGCRLAALE